MMSTDSVIAKWDDCGNDPKVDEIAKWAVNEYDKEHRKKLVLVKVLTSHLTTVVHIGVLYRLSLEIKNDDAHGRHEDYVALVLVKLNGGKELWEFYFVAINHEIIGGWTDTGNVVGIEEELAKFAVDEYNKKEETTLEFTKLKSAQKQLVAGILYRLTLEAIDDGHKNLYQALVLVKPWENIKELEDFKPLLLNAED